MKKVSIALSALAVAATVSTAMAHSKSTVQPFCIAVDENNEPVEFTPGVNTLTPCTVLTLGRTTATATNQYGYLKNTPTNQPCQIAACRAIAVTGE